MLNLFNGFAFKKILELTRLIELQLDDTFISLRYKKIIMGVGGIVVITFLFCMALMIVIEIIERMYDY